MRIVPWSLQAASLAALTLATTACTVNVHDHHERHDEGPTVVQRQYEYQSSHVVVVDRPPSGYATVVREAPPPVYSEAIPLPPDRDSVWISGYWVAHDHHWVWVRGHYEHPPRRDAHWDAHVWERHGDQFELHIGGWH